MIVLSAAMLLAASSLAAAAVAVSVVNPGTEPRGGVVLGSLQELGVERGDGLVAVDETGPLPTQVSGDQIAVLVPEIPAAGRRRIRLVAGETPKLAAELRCSEDAAALMVTGNRLKLVFDKKRNGLTVVQLGGEAFAGYPYGYDLWVFPPTTDKQDMFSFAPAYRQHEAKDLKLEAEAAGPLFSQLRVSWSCPVARVEQRYTCVLGGESMRVEVRVELTGPVNDVVFNTVGAGEFDLDALRFQPANERVPGFFTPGKSCFHGRVDAAPNYVAAWSPRKKGLGLAVLEPGLFDRLAYGARNSPLFFRVAPYQASNPHAWDNFFMVAGSPSLLSRKPGAVLGGAVELFSVPEESGGEARFQATRQRLRLVKDDAPLPSMIPAGQPAVSLESIVPDKVLYGNHEAAVCRVAVRNWENRPARVTLKFRLLSDLDREEELGEAQLDLDANQRLEHVLNWNTGARQDGHELRCLLLKDGRELARASEYFNIADDWVHLMQWGGCEAYLYSRWQYVNTDWYQGAVDEFGNINGGLDTYNVRRGEGGRPVPYQLNGVGIRETLRRGRAEGKKQMVYYYVGGTQMQRPDFDRNPELIMYQRDGQPTDCFGPVPNFYLSAWRDWWVEMMNAGIAEMGWDACFFDCSQEFPEFSYKYFDLQGRPAGAGMGATPDAAGAAFLKEITSRIRAKHPKFTFSHNPEVFKSEFQYPLSFTAGGASAMLELGGGGSLTTDKGSKYGRWSSLAENFSTLRQTKRRYGVENVFSYVLAQYAGGGEITAKTMDALLFANGFGGGTVLAPSGSVHAEPHRQYMQFGAARYSALVYGKDRAWIQPGEAPVAFNAPERVLWKDYVYRRDTANETDVIVHLVQLPPDELVWRQPGRQAKLENLPMSVRLPAGTTFKEVRLLSPDRALREETLRAEVKDGVVSFTIPDLWIYNMIVLRATKGVEP
jgi:hypothetical protein